MKRLILEFKSGNIIKSKAIKNIIKNYCPIMWVVLKEQNKID